MCTISHSCAALFPTLSYLSRSLLQCSGYGVALAQGDAPYNALGALQTLQGSNMGALH
jgi:hypothetical protein